MNLWIKICGLSTHEAVAAAVDAGANAIGFVFAPSKRRVDAASAALLARSAPAHVVRVAVMQHPAQSLLDEVWRVFRPDVLQTDLEDLRDLEIPVGLAVLPVARAAAVIPQPMPTRLLFEGPASGTGVTTDWQQAAALAVQTQLVLAGGLNAGNVGAAVRAVRPFGVDVSSGVESAPGIKDVSRIHQFVSVARKATDEAESRR